MFLVVSFHVGDYDTWRKEFEADHERLSGSSLSTRVMRSLDDGNDATVVSEWPDRKAAEALVANPELQQAMASGGVEGPPQIRFVEEVARYGPGGRLEGIGGA
jgi:quinol monooxygenase YgiN